jgi:TetR/AcrR family transcriptional repressor of nem operon
MPRDGTATKQRILDVAERLMIEQGYSATSVDQLIAESGTSKGAFFHHFDSKAALARSLVGRYVEGDLAHLHAGLAAVAAVEDPAQRLLAFLRYYEDSADELMQAQSGCLYATALAEQELLRGEVNDLIGEATAAWREAIVALLRPALRQRRRDAPRIDLDALADHMYVTFEGAFLLCRSVNDNSAMRAQLRVFRQLVEALLDAPA